MQACKPWQILAITFTNKAAAELKTRLVTMLGEDGNDIWASTFHSMCARILRRDGERLGYTNRFTIYDTDDSAV
ncbi:MAG: UvrD-helicase domain-containing protein [Acutalibacteraceae bacterium]